MILPIIVGAIATFIFGMLWYGPVFGKAWMRMMRVTHEQMEEAKKRGMAGQMVVLFIFLLVTAKVVAWLIPALMPMSFSAFYHSIFIIWLGFAFPVQLGAW